jgi:hypothetical protein
MNAEALVTSVKADDPELDRLQNELDKLKNLLQ